MTLTGRPNVRQYNLWKFGLAVLLVACTPFFDTEPQGEIHDGESNACGGDVELTFDGERAGPGDPCGVCPGEGHLACNGVDALRCVGATPPNPCGGCLPLGGVPFEPCGVCPGAAAGYYVCDGENALECVTEAGYTSCGGCTPLTGEPGQPCDADDPTASWTCASSSETECVSGGPSICGGDEELTFEGIDSPAPGMSCAGACDPPGVLRCRSPESIVCEEAGETNVCGGCGPLPGNVGDECGPCGRRICDDGNMFCVDPEPNACGGCQELPAAPGEACDGGTIVCNGADAVICVPQSDDTNACGGLGALDNAPGTPCGECDTGLWVCDGTSSVICAGDLGRGARNGCGGCEPLPAGPDDPCGECGSGIFACDPSDDNRLVCTGNQGPAAQNACGGCAFLWGEPGDPCGECFHWQCSESDPDTVACVWAGDEPGGCEGDPCAVCEDLFRECVGGECGDCVDGYVDEGGDCVVEGQFCEDSATCPNGEPILTGECVRLNIETCSPAGRGPGSFDDGVCSDDGICITEPVRTSVECVVDVVGQPCRWDDGIIGSCADDETCIPPNVVYQISLPSRASEVTSPVCPDSFELVAGGCLDESGTPFFSSSPTNLRHDDASGDFIFDESWTCRWPVDAAATPRNAIGVCVRDATLRERWFVGVSGGPGMSNGESPSCLRGFVLSGGCSASDDNSLFEFRPHLYGDTDTGEHFAREDGTWICRAAEAGVLATGAMCGSAPGRRIRYTVSDAVLEESVDAGCGTGLLIGGACLAGEGRPIFGSHPFPLIGTDQVWRCSAAIEERRAIRSIAICLDD